MAVTNAPGVAGEVTRYRNMNLYAKTLVLDGNTLSGTELGFVDGVTAGTGAVSRALVLDASGDLLYPSSGTLSFWTATDALIMGAGTSAAQVALGATAGTALNFRFSATHTTGDMRGLYVRIDASGAGGSGEALRALYEVENVSVATGGTVNGAHITLELDGNSGQASGAGNAARFTLGGSGTKTLGGTLSGVLVDLDLPSATTLGGGEAAIRIGKAQDHEWPVAIAFDSTVGSGNAIQTSAVTPTGATTHAIHIKVDGTSGYIPVYAAAAFGN